MNTNLINLISMETTRELGSKVRGNRNWSIRTEQTSYGKVAYIGRRGVMEERRMFSFYLWEIGEYNIRLYDFTYKKDFLEAVKTLEKNGYKIKWVA